MYTRRPRLIACDLDGTLLLNGAQTLQPPIFDLIRRVQAQGIRFFAASGRQYTSIRRLFDPIREEIGYICENGGFSVLDGSALFKELMDPALARQVMREALATPGTELLISGPMTSYLQPKSERYLRLIRDEMRNDVTLVPDLLALDGEILKVSLYQEGGLRDPEGWAARWGDRCTVVTGGHAWLDIMPPHVNKGAALERVLRHLGIDAADCMAIGDNDNDREMLQLAGLPVAMAHGRQAVREVAQREIHSVDELLEELLRL